MSSVDVVRRLGSIDWDFPQAGNVANTVHSLHWFPGNFIPQIPAAMIQVLSEPGQIVLDPFGGSGTTGVEALRLGRRAIVSDSVSACILIADAKFALLRGGVRRGHVEELGERLVFEHLCRTPELGQHGEGSSAEIAKWYDRETLQQLRFLWQLVESAESTDERLVLTVLFSDVLFDCASPGVATTSTGKIRRHHWGWVADNVKPTRLVPHNAVSRFRARLKALGDILEAAERVACSSTADLLSSAMPHDMGVVVRQDARNMELATASVDLVVTSPPYVGMVDYTRANRLLYEWMGWSILDERKDEIGARYRRKRIAAVGEYLQDMCRARDEILRVLRPGAYCALVIGESRKFPGTVEQVVAEFSQAMPLVWGPTLRRPTRRRVSDRSANDAAEFVLVVRKD